MKKVNNPVNNSPLLKRAIYKQSAYRGKRSPQQLISMLRVNIEQAFEVHELFQQTLQQIPNIMLRKLVLDGYISSEEALLVADKKELISRAYEVRSMCIGHVRLLLGLEPCQGQPLTDGQRDDQLDAWALTSNL